MRYLPTNQPTIQPINQPTNQPCQQILTVQGRIIASCNTSLDWPNNYFAYVHKDVCMFVLYVCVCV